MSALQNSIPHTTANGQLFPTDIQNGVHATAPATWAVYVAGEQVTTAHGDFVKAMDTYRKWRDTLATDAKVKDSLDTPFEQLPDKYFKNGHIPPLELPDETFTSSQDMFPDSYEDDSDPVYWRQELAGGDTMQIHQSGKVSYV